MSSILSNRILMASIFAIVVGTATASAHPLVNPGFDDLPPGPVGGFGTVVGPPFDDGYWGAENSNFTGPTAGVIPQSAPQMLEMIDDGLSYTQAWQVIYVADDSLTYVGLSAHFTVPDGSPGAVAAVTMRAFCDSDSWPTTCGIWSATGTLDGLAATWELVSLAPVLIPANTTWILAEVSYRNAELIERGTNGYVDDVQLIPEPASLSLMGLGLLGLALLRRRQM